MLPQEINLYKTFEKPRSTLPFSAWRMLLISGSIVILLLLMTYLITAWQVNFLKTQLHSLVKDEKKLQQQFLTQKNQYPSFFFSKDTAHFIDTLQKGNDSKEKIFRLLSNTIPFNKVLMALSNTITPSVWLTHISIDKSGHKVMLTGKATVITSLQIFLNQLLKEKIFHSFSMQINSITNTKDSSIFQITFEDKTP
ncbi:MAG: hypothetical protein A3E85_02185 [Gammaproteobacteria bacterium RIFCSPHIGHO2_12_FULL_45_12]|nr:MAG: hypothetical protein A3E85_02185 [Gammaproteobacteria bacterium RIFCSPHIGHO2_12_FULL_45_12]